ncbi:MAG: hypothetical protein EOO59_03110 [Hymenobacter sp.]|nr:MAG: hypothetical protein EOO59_03110 [Hymenobacter sp.]
MSKLVRIAACLSSLLAGPAAAAAPAAGRLVQLLPAKWQFRQAGQEAWHPATVPDGTNYCYLLLGQPKAVVLRGGPPRPGAWQQQVRTRSLVGSF